MPGICKNPQEVVWLTGKDWTANQSLLHGWLKRAMHQSKLKCRIEPDALLKGRKIGVQEVTLAQFYEGILLVKNPDHVVSRYRYWSNPLNSILLEAGFLGVPLIVVNGPRILQVHKQEAKLLASTRGIR